MTPATRILRAVQPDNGGPTYRTVLEHLAEHHGAASGKACLDQLIAAGKLVQYGKKRGARWGLPRVRAGGAPKKPASAKAPSRRLRWTPAQERQLRKLYPHCSTALVAKALGATINRINAKATKLGLRKTAKYLAGPDACRLRRGDNVGAPFRFQKGHVPANKGLRRPGWAAGRMRETQFKKGQWPRNKDPEFYVIGALRVNTEGYIEMRTSFDKGALGWTTLHRILWEDAHGPVPAGHCLRFKDRDKLNVELANLECITLAENRRRNSIHTLPAPLKETIMALGRLKRRIRREEQDRRSA